MYLGLWFFALWPWCIYLFTMRLLNKKYKFMILHALPLTRIPNFGYARSSEKLSLRLTIGPSRNWLRRPVRFIPAAPESESSTLLWSSLGPWKFNGFDGMGPDRKYTDEDIANGDPGQIGNAAEKRLYQKCMSLPFLRSILDILN